MSEKYEVEECLNEKLKTVNKNTFVMLKPDSLDRSLVGIIISRFERAGFYISNIKMVMPTAEQFSLHYSHLPDDVVKKICRYINAPVIIMVLYGSNAVEKVRKIVGITEPLKASMGTIRGDFGNSDFISAETDEWNPANNAIRNLIHCSDSDENAEKEIKIWFDGVNRV